MPVELSASACRLIDETGLTMEMQRDLVNPVARRIGQQKLQIFQKMFLVSHTHKLYQTVEKGIKKYRRGMAPQSLLEACYSLVAPLTPSLMHEADCIRVCDEALSQYFTHYKIRLASSELLECIFEECQIDIADRLPQLQSLAL